MRYRTASAADARLIAPLNRRLILDEGHRNSMTIAELESRMQTWLEQEYQAVLFEDEQGIAGYALFKREPDWLYLRQFFVAPERRRCGVGSAAIKWLLENAWQDAPRIRLDVLIGNGAGIQFWRSVGFADYCVTMEKSISRSRHRRRHQRTVNEHPLPSTPAEWLREIVVAMADAREAKPFGKLIGHRITEADLYHLAPHVCLKFRGRKRTGKEASRVIETSLANYIANSDPDGIDHNLEHRPFMAFALCYLASHLCLDLIDEQKCEAVLNYCEDHLGDE